MEKIDNVYMRMSRAKANLHELTAWKVRITSDKSKALKSIDAIIRDLDRCRGILADHILNESGKE